MIFLFSKIVFMFSFISSLCSPNYVYAAHTHTKQGKLVLHVYQKVHRKLKQLKRVSPTHALGLEENTCLVIVVMQ